MSADATLARAVEKQMRNWEIARQQRPGPEREAHEADVHEFVTISRRAGSAGIEIARELGERLGWPVFDREILQHMAKDDALRARLYENMDERDTSWLESVLRWVLHGEFRKEDYFHRLTETVLALARQGPAVFLGRGADLILPKDRGLRVALYAPEDVRVREYAAVHGCDEKTARDQIHAADAEREEFIRNHFAVDPNDITRFDLLLNVGRLTRTQVVEIIAAALAARGDNA